LLARRARLAAAALALASGCSRASAEPAPVAASAAPVPPRFRGAAMGGGSPRAPDRDGANAERRLPAEERTFVFEDTPVGRMVVVVLVPERAPGERFPLLIPFHGLGEAKKGPDRGARAWVEDYALGRALRRLAAPPLTASDFESFVTPERLARLNESLRERPYRGLVIACPYTPDMLRGEEPFTPAPPLARFVVETLLPRLRRETPALSAASATGIDGVSLGGRAAIAIGLLEPTAFGAIAGIQAALDRKNARDVAERAKRARERNSGLVFRLLTSDDDFFRRANVAIARALERAGVPVFLDVVPGPHDYAFNRGPGALEMLLFHDRVLRGEPPL